MEETTMLPALLPVEPKLKTFDAVLEWNYAEIESYLKAVTELYRNLVVTDDNVEDMGKVKREVVSLRTHLQKFERATKTKLKKPVDEFTMQCRNLQQIVAAVEEPLNAQLQIYEDRRIAEMKGQIQRELEAKAKALRPFVEKLISLAKRQKGLITKRQLAAKLYSAEAVKRLLKTYAARYQSRPGGYTRILKLKRRFGDNAPLVKIELV